MFKTVYNHTCGKHSYCAECMQDVIEVALQGKQHFPPRCPCKGPKNVIDLKVVEERIGNLWKGEKREQLVAIYESFASKKDKMILVPAMNPPALW